MSDHRSYFAVIPASVRYDDTLIPNAKLLYGEITALCNEKGYCWASNDYFASQYKVGKSTIQNWLKSLEDRGFIYREVKYKKGTKEIEARYIRILDGPTQKNVGGSPEKWVTPHPEIYQDNNTSFNNTFNNTNKEEGDTSSRKYSDEHFRLATQLKNNLTNDFPKEMAKANLVKWADVIRLMEEKDNHTLEQIEYVINWLPSNEFWFGNIRSAKKLRDKFESLKFEIKKEKSKKSQNGKQFIREETLPDRFIHPDPEPEISPERQAEIDAKLQAYLEKKGAASK